MFVRDAFHLDEAKHEWEKFSIICCSILENALFVKWSIPLEVNVSYSAPHHMRYDRHISLLEALNVLRMHNEYF